MKPKTLISTLAALISILVLVSLSRTDKLLLSATSDSGRMKAEIIHATKGLFAREYQLRITNAEENVSFTSDEPKLDQISETQIPNLKLTWNSDDHLSIVLPTGEAIIVRLNQAQ